MNRFNRRLRRLEYPSEVVKKLSYSEKKRLIKDLVSFDEYEKAFQYPRPEGTKILPGDMIYHRTPEELTEEEIKERSRIKKLKTSILKKKYRKDKGRSEWALMSKKDPKKVLKWFKGKPSKEQVAKEEKRVQWFKRHTLNDIIIKIAAELKSPEELKQDIENVKKQYNQLVQKYTGQVYLLFNKVIKLAKEDVLPTEGFPPDMYEKMTSNLNVFKKSLKSYYDVLVAFNSEEPEVKELLMDIGEYMDTIIKTNEVNSILQKLIRESKGLSPKKKEKRKTRRQILEEKLHELSLNRDPLLEKHTSLKTLTNEDIKRIKENPSSSYFKLLEPKIKKLYNFFNLYNLGIEYSEAQREAQYAALIALNTYDPEKGTLNNLIYVSIKNWLIDMIRTRLIQLKNKVSIEKYENLLDEYGQFVKNYKKPKREHVESNLKNSYKIFRKKIIALQKKIILLRKITAEMNTDYKEPKEYKITKPEKSKDIPVMFLDKVDYIGPIYDEKGRENYNRWLKDIPEKYRLEKSSRRIRRLIKISGFDIGDRVEINPNAPRYRWEKGIVRTIDTSAKKMDFILVGVALDRHSGEGIFYFRPDHLKLIQQLELPIEKKEPQLKLFEEKYL